jgi:1-acyl-sn-glycerol-3-phosphate acyltransferase
LIVVANHQAVMESVMLAVFPPWQIEILGQADIPHEKLTDVVTRFFGFIPIRRGRLERGSLEMALDVLRQKGTIGIYPEGGIWDAGAMRAQTGVSWLSYRGNASVLPIGFSGTTGALGAAAKFKRPKITMRVGKLLPPANPLPEMPRKAYFQEYASVVMQAIQALIPESERPKGAVIRDERFELSIEVQNTSGEVIDCPAEFSVQHTQAAAKFLHRPGILKIFRSNLQLPTAPLERLDEGPSAQEIELASRAILNYLHNDNPYLLTYRFGPKEAEAMHSGLSEIHALSEWAMHEGYTLHIIPIRRYYLADGMDEIVQVKQDKFEDWM